jgi:Flp pilus assembly protein TadD
MKYRVNHLLSTSILLTIFLGVPVITAGQSTQCDCATPPGGSVTCEKGQVPICIVKNGKVTSICKSPPEDKKTIAQQNAWVLSIILGKEVTEDDLKHRPEYQGFLRKGQLNMNDAQIMFVGFKPPVESLPQRLRRASGGPGTVAKHGPLDYKNYDRSSFYYDRGWDLLKSSENAAAETEFREYVKLKPTDEDGYWGIGLSFHRRGRLDDAVAAYRQGLRLNPGSADLNAALGIVYYEQDKFSEAEESLKKAVSFEPNDAEFYGALGTILYAQLKFADAEAAFRQATQLGGARSAALNNSLGDALFAQQKYAEAKAAYALAERLR